MRGQTGGGGPHGGQEVQHQNNGHPHTGGGVAGGQGHGSRSGVSAEHLLEELEEEACQPHLIATSVSADPDMSADPEFKFFAPALSVKARTADYRVVTIAAVGQRRTNFYLR